MLHSLPWLSSMPPSYHAAMHVIPPLPFAKDGSVGSGSVAAFGLFISCCVGVPRHHVRNVDAKAAKCCIEMPTVDVARARDSRHTRSPQISFTLSLFSLLPSPSLQIILVFESSFPSARAETLLMFQLAIAIFVITFCIGQSSLGVLCI